MNDQPPPGSFPDSGGPDSGGEPNFSDGEPNNPFKGTPFEAIFSQLGSQLGPMFAQMQSQFAAMTQPSGSGPLNWDVAIDMARKASLATPDPSVSAAQRDRVADAMRLADHWLDGTTDFSSGVTIAEAWSRAEWLTITRPVWETLVNPVAESAAANVGGDAAALGPLSNLLSGAVGAMLAGQVASGLGGLSTEVVSSSDIGLPLAPAGRAGLVIGNVEAFATGLGVSIDDAVLYVALREAAHQRLFAHVPWLRDYVTQAVATYAAGVQVNLAQLQERVQDQLSSLNATNLEELQDALEGTMFEVDETPAQRAALEQIEIVLALIEGWVDEVVAQATATRMPAAAALSEAVRRRRAAGGPAEQTFATLVGLEMRPRRMRDAATLWASLRERQGVEARDGVWMHPSLLPTSADLDDPLGFREGAEAIEEMTPEEFDAGLAALLDQDSPE